MDIVFLLSFNLLKHSISSALCSPWTVVQRKGGREAWWIPFFKCILALFTLFYPVLSLLSIVIWCTIVDMCSDLCMSLYLCDSSRRNGMCVQLCTTRTRSHNGGCSDSGQNCMYQCVRWGGGVWWDRMDKISFLFLGTTLVEMSGASSGEISQLQSFQAQFQSNIYCIHWFITSHMVLYSIVLE